MIPDREDQCSGLRQAGRASAPLPSASQEEAAALLPDHVSHNIEAIRMLHMRADETVSRYQRPIETVHEPVPAEARHAHPETSDTQAGHSPAAQ